MKSMAGVALCEIRRITILGLPFWVVERPKTPRTARFSGCQTLKSVIFFDPEVCVFFLYVLSKMHMQ